jgi:hypothetical protein
VLRRAISDIHHDAEPLSVDDRGVAHGGYLVPAGAIERATLLVDPQPDDEEM